MDAGCQLLKPSKANGYIQVSYNGCKSITLHVLSGFDRFDDLPSEGCEVSHLCHNRQCFNPLHLCYESRESNNQRKGCLVCIEDEKGRIRRLCQHDPPCILTFDPIKIKDCPLYSS